MLTACAKCGHSMSVKEETVTVLVSLYWVKMTNMPGSQTASAEPRRAIYATLYTCFICKAKILIDKGEDAFWRDETNYKYPAPYQKPPTPPPTQYQIEMNEDDDKNEDDPIERIG